MKPEQSIKRHILMGMLTEKQMDEDDTLDLSNPDGVDAAYEQAEEYTGSFADTEIIDDESDFRCGGEQTDIACDGSRYYESYSVARKLSDGSWVGWTYWYGGGKHAEPEAMDWMDSAYYLSVTEEEKTVVVKTFKKK